MKNIYPFIFSTVVTLSELADGRGRNFYFYVDCLAGEIHRGLGMGVDADIEHLLCAVNKSFIHKGILV